jgi:hypothetical protein
MARSYCNFQIAARFAIFALDASIGWELERWQATAIIPLPLQPDAWLA